MFKYEQKFVTCPYTARLKQVDFIQKAIIERIAPV